MIKQSKTINFQPQRWYSPQGKCENTQEQLRDMDGVTGVIKSTDGVRSVQLGDYLGKKKLS